MKILEKIAKIKNNQSKIFDAGKQEEHNTFFDGYQRKGIKDSYTYLYAGVMWKANNFDMVHSIIATRSDFMFANSQINIDLADYLEKKGLVIDTSAATNIGNMFSYSRFTRIGEISTISASNLNNMCVYSGDLVTIDKIILKSDGTQIYNGAFTNCPALEEIRFEGVIGRNFNIQHSTKLSRASIENIVGVLHPTVTGYSVTFSKTAKEAAFTADEWTALTATKSNWTFNLV